MNPFNFVPTDKPKELTTTSDVGSGQTDYSIVLVAKSYLPITREADSMEHRQQTSHKSCRPVCKTKSNISANVKTEDEENDDDLMKLYSGLPSESGRLPSLARTEWW